MPRARLVVVVLAASIACASSASAEPSAAARADALYKEALALADKGRYAEACPKYAESQRLDPALGTQFNLADCHEHTDRLASAYELFGEVERSARAAGKEKLALRARARVRALEPRITRLRVKLAAPIDDLVVRVDGTRIELDGDATMAVDPGEHAIEATAPGRLPHRTSVTATTPGFLDVTVPELESPPPPRVAEAPPEPRPSPAFRTAGVVVAAAGGVGIVVGGIFGVTALSRRNEAQRLCGNDDAKLCGSEEGVVRWRDAKDAGNVSTIAFAAGLALVGTGAALWFFAPETTVSAGATAEGGAVFVKGRF